MEQHEILLTVLIAFIVFYFIKKFMNGKMFNTKAYDLRGKYAVVTGGNSGIGKQTVLELIKLNCNVIIGARDKAKSQQTIKLINQIIKSKKDQSTILVQHFYLDLASKQSIQQFATLVNRKFAKIDYLVNNAGLLIPNRSTTKDGFEMSYGVNHLGHFYLTNLLMQSLKKSQQFRIVNVSSMAHLRILGFLSKTDLDWQNINFDRKDSYQQDLAYSRSKLYNILFTKSLSEKVPSGNGLCVAIHPGVVRTQITRNVKVLEYFILLIYPVYWLFTKNLYQGAQTIIYAILSQNVVTGSYYADCQSSQVHQLAKVKQNRQKLWSISQQHLKTKFLINF